MAQNHRGGDGSIYPYKTKRGRAGAPSFATRAAGRPPAEGSPAVARRSANGNVSWAAFIAARSARRARTWPATGSATYTPDGPTWRRVPGRTTVATANAASFPTSATASSPRSPRRSCATGLVELSETGEWAPKTLNNALKALVVCLNGVPPL